MPKNKNSYWAERARKDKIKVINTGEKGIDNLKRLLLLNLKDVEKQIKDFYEKYGDNPAEELSNKNWQRYKKRLRDMAKANPQDKTLQKLAKQNIPKYKIDRLRALELDLQMQLTEATNGQAKGIYNTLDDVSKAIEIMDSHKEIKTLTTQIYDLAWKKNRVELFGPEISKGIHKIYMFCGGSHFLCRSFFGNSIPYYPNKYGYEEIFPSLAVYDANFINAFAEELTVVHNPLIDKWDRNKKGGIYLYATGLAQNFLMKSTIFPILYTPLNFAALCLRLAKGCSWSLTKHTISIIISSHIEKGTRKRLKYSTISNLYKDFQLSIF